MFDYDSDILAVVETVPQTIPDVLQSLQAIDSLCAAEDGLKWFNGLYLSVTQAVEDRVQSGGFHDPAFLAQLDIQFARLYFNAARAVLTGAPCPGCWEAMFAARGNLRLARLQFALAGVNAHINHDLCLAIEATCRAVNSTPQKGSPQYDDYTAVNTTLDSLIEEAKKTLQVRLPGDPLPPVSHLEDLIAGWNVCAARETAWINAEQLWYLPAPLSAGLMGTIDGFTTVIGKGLLVPVP